MNGIGESAFREPFESFAELLVSVNVAGILDSRRSVVLDTHVLRSNRQIEKLKTFTTFKFADFDQMIGPDTPECNFRSQIHWKTRSIGVQENAQRFPADLSQLLIFVAFPHRRTPFGVSPRMRPHWKGDRESPARRKQDYFKLRIFPEAMIAGCSDDPP